MNRISCFGAIVPILLLMPAHAAAQKPPSLDSASAHRMYEIVGNLNGVDPALLEAMASTESAGNPQAVSRSGAEGLMQLMPATAEQFEVEDVFDPLDNLLGAARFIRFLQGSPNAQGALPPNLLTIIAAYNAGPGAVAKYHGIPPYPETQEYVRRVLFAYLLSDQPQRVHVAPRPVATPMALHPLRKASRDAHWLSQLQRLRSLRDQSDRAQANVTDRNVATGR